MKNNEVTLKRDFPQQIPNPNCQVLTGRYKFCGFILSWILITMTSLFIACENPITGYGPQPNFIEGIKL